MDHNASRHYQRTNLASADPVDRFVADPHVSAGQADSSSPKESHKGHGWMHWAMCAPMLLVVGYLVLTGSAGGGAVVYALGCVLMLGVMMLLMNRSGGGHSGHRH